LLKLIISSFLAGNTPLKLIVSEILVLEYAPFSDKAISVAKLGIVISKPLSRALS
jgi:hypothetical protein